MLAPMNIPTTAVSADMKLRAAAVFIDKPALRSTAKSPVIDEIGHFNTGLYKHNNHCHQCRYEVRAAAVFIDKLALRCSANHLCETK